MTENDNPVDMEFIEEKIESKTPVKMFLVNGVKLEGTIFKQDRTSLIMSGINKGMQLVFKRNISTIT